jgi:hypothetical protein
MVRFVVVVGLWLGIVFGCDILPAQEPTKFDVASFQHWMSLDGSPVNEGWKIEDGTIHLTKGKVRGGHILTKSEFQSFSLEFEWKIAPKGNSGIKYMVNSYGGQKLGLEYQIYDDAGAKSVPNRNSTGSIYDLFAPDHDKELRPAGEWNHGKIVVNKNRIEHWLNGKKITAAMIGDDEWNKRVAESKFNDVPKFCETLKGRIMLTDHGSEVWYRNFVFSSLNDTE